jgi:pimeloyl-ACP methyl ester carboxylesterase
MKPIAALSLMCLASVLTSQKADTGTPLGQLIDIGGRKLHVHCTGSGAPTVLLEAGASSFALDWALVQPEIARDQRVCSYDRAGHGWSDARGEVDTSARIVADLHALLAASGQKPPYLMVGASRGGLYVRLYQLEFPKEVAGIVLVDSATEDRLFTMLKGEAVAIAELSADELRTTLPASGSVPIPRRAPQTGAPFDRLPPELYKLRVALDQKLIDAMPATVSADVIRESAEAEREALARLRNSRSVPAAPYSLVPVVALTRGDGLKSGLAESHAALARLAKNSRHTVVADSGHEIHLFMPAAVIQAVRDVTLAIRQGTQLPPR